MMRHIIFIGLTAGYLAVALFGHFEALAHLINGGCEPQRVTSAKKTSPIDSHPFWTQKKHLPVSTQKIEAPAETARSTTLLLFNQGCEIVPFSLSAFLSAESAYPPFRPRDPPSA
jgi:hypothetical protein